MQAIITGRVVRRGDDLSIRVELIDARDNKQLWGDQFNRKAADALAIESEIAQTVSSMLRLKLSGTQEQQLSKRGVISRMLTIWYSGVIFSPERKGRKIQREPWNITMRQLLSTRITLSPTPNWHIFLD